MQKFKDRDGKTWKIELTVGSITRIKQDSGGRFNLFDPDSLVDGRSLASIVFAEHLSDWATLWELVYFAVEGEKPDAVEFGDTMAGDCLVAAQRALIEEWRDFFRLLQRPDLALVLEKRLAEHGHCPVAATGHDARHGLLLLLPVRQLRRRSVSGGVPD